MRGKGKNTGRDAPSHYRPYDMELSGIVKTSLIDFPGTIASVIFCQGCNYSCFYCHNRALLPKKRGTLKTDQVLSFLSARRGLVEGIVVSGGEPTQQDDLAAFITELREIGFTIKLDTNGSNPLMLANLLEMKLLDYVAMDIKAPWHRYVEICGSKAKPRFVEESLKQLTESTVLWEARTTLAPGISMGDLLGIARVLPHNTRWRLNLYKKPEVFDIHDQKRVNTPAANEKDITIWKGVLKDNNPNFRYEDD